MLRGMLSEPFMHQTSRIEDFFKLSERIDNLCLTIIG
jgi:hypothetical protein